MKHVKKFSEGWNPFKRNVVKDELPELTNKTQFVENVKKIAKELSTELIGKEFMNGEINEINVINDKEFAIDIILPKKIKTHRTNRRIKTTQHIDTLNVKVEDSISIYLTQLISCWDIDEEPEEDESEWIEHDYYVSSLTRKDANLILEIVNNLTNKEFDIQDIVSGKNKKNYDTIKIR